MKAKVLSALAVCSAAAVSALVPMVPDLVAGAPELAPLVSAVIGIVLYRLKAYQAE